MEYNPCGDPKRRGAAEIDREMVGDVYAALHQLADGRPLQSLKLWAHWRHLNLAVGYPRKGDDGKTVVKSDAEHWTSTALNQVVLDVQAGSIDPKAMSKKEMLGYARAVSAKFMNGYFGEGVAAVNAANPLVAWYDGVVWARVQSQDGARRRGTIKRRTNVGYLRLFWAGRAGYLG